MANTTPKKSESAGKPITEYLPKLPQQQQAIVLALAGVVRGAVPEAAEAMKWGQPVWSGVGPAIWIKAFPRYVSIGFWRGAEMVDPGGKLGGDGDRMRHIKVASVEAVDADLIAGFARQAIDLNVRLGDPTKRAS